VSLAGHENLYKLTCPPSRRRLCMQVHCVAGMKSCESWEFSCVTVPRCILKLFVCNDRDDCGDLSDEDDEICSQFVIFSSYSATVIVVA